MNTATCVDCFEPSLIRIRQSCKHQRAVHNVHVMLQQDRLAVHSTADMANKGVLLMLHTSEDVSDMQHAASHAKL